MPDAPISSASPTGSGLTGADAVGVLQALFEGSSVGLGVWDRELRYRLVNPALAEMNGLAPDAHLGRTIQDVLGALGEELAGVTIDREIVEGDQAVVLFETRLDGVAAQGLNHLELTADGRVRALTVFFRPLASLQRIAEVIGRHMERRFGPPPE